jgi:hypothetical protein
MSIVRTSFNKKINLNNEKLKFFYENGFYRYSDIERTEKLLNYYFFLKKTQKIKGSFIEFGVFKGNSSFKLLILSKILKINREANFFDFFSKFDDSKITKEDKYEFSLFLKEAGDKSISSLDFSRNIKKRKLSNKFKLHKGDIFHTFKKFLKKNQKIALVNLDVDLFNVTEYVLNNIWPKMSKKGIIILDDFKGFPGATRAINKFARKKKILVKKIGNIKKSYYLEK